MLWDVTVMRLTSPFPEVPTVVPPVAGLSQVISQTLLEESVASEVKETGPNVMGPSGGGHWLFP